jgi:formylglycine-generating enzyme required for sulfatase activity
MGPDVRLAAVIAAGAVGLSLAAAPAGLLGAPRAFPLQAATAQAPATPPAPAGTPSPASTAFESYTESIPGTAVRFDMVAVPGGTAKIGSPASEAGRGDDEGPQVTVKVGPFWMGRLEVTWAEFDLYAFAKKGPPPAGTAPAGADAVSRPTPPYADESWGFGKDKQPALGMTWHAAAEYCRWLSAKTGKTYRLATEAEWEYAARAGTTTPWSSGAADASLDDVAWYAKNSGGKPHLGGQKKPNAFGLFDMHGTVAEWVIDQHEAKRYQRLAALPSPVMSPVALPGPARYPNVVRGGGFEDVPAALRSAARRASDPEWSRRDSQLPQSIWWHTDAITVGFRVVRPVDETPALTGFKSKVTRESPDYGQ